jgi:hypothetical protein
MSKVFGALSVVILAVVLSAALEGSFTPLMADNSNTLSPGNSGRTIADIERGSLQEADQEDGDVAADDRDAETPRPAVAVALPSFEQDARLLPDIPPRFLRRT